MERKHKNVHNQSKRSQKQVQKLGKPKNEQNCRNRPKKCAKNLTINNGKNAKRVDSLEIHLLCAPKSTKMGGLAWLKV